MSYGPHERNVLDLWKAPAAQPTPLVVYIHGGGFSAGSKANAPGTLVRALLKEGISVMSISYRLSPYEAASPITYLTKDDPPVYLFYGEARGPLPANARDGQGIHHINFGLRLKEQMNPLGIECIVRHADEGTDRDAEMVAFFNKRLVPARAK